MNKRAVNTEVLAREIVFLTSDGEQLLKKFDDRLVLNQALTVLAEHRGHPEGILDGQSYEPATQQVVAGLLRQRALQAYAVEHLQAHRPDEPLRGDARTSAFHIGAEAQSASMSTARTSARAPD